MKVLFPLILLSLSLVTLAPQGWAKDVPYTLEDRDRLIRLEADVAYMKERFDQVDKHFESIERRIERLEDIMMWGFGLLLTTMVGLASFVLWDRRSALAPAIRKTKELEEEDEKIKRVLKEYAAKNPEFREILKKVAMF